MQTLRDWLNFLHQQTADWVRLTFLGGSAIFGGIRPGKWRHYHPQQQRHCRVCSRCGDCRPPAALCHETVKIVMPTKWIINSTLVKYVCVAWYGLIPTIPWLFRFQLWVSSQSSIKICTVETLVCHTCRNVEVDIFAVRNSDFSPWLTFERFENTDRREDWTLIICLTFISGPSSTLHSYQICSSRGSPAQFTDLKYWLWFNTVIESR